MFESIKAQVQARFARLASTGLLFQTDVDRDEIFQTYLDAFPEDERQGHNCNCCKSFLRQYGSLVAVVDGQVWTMWEFEAEAPYTAVPAALDSLVRRAKITNQFFTDTHKLGTDSNVQLLEGGNTIRWEHFFVKLPNSWPKTNRVSIPTVISDRNARKQVFHRGLAELTPEATNTVLELIAQNSLYRGAEFKPQVQKLQQYQQATAGMTPEELDLFTWEHLHDPVMIRNTAIGTLLIDLSVGRDLDQAVAAYERMVAPANYRRPTAVVTQGMREKAAKDLAEQGLDKALARRHAHIDDIPVGEVYFVNRSVAKGGVFDQLVADAPVDVRQFSKVEEVPIETFIREVLPTATNIEVLLENRHTSNLVNLTAPVDPDAPRLFPWPSGVAWSYNGNMADSIKERVKQAGGKIEGYLRVSLGWENSDDLDLRIREPNGHVIYFGAKRSHCTGGALDVDMNAHTITPDPVENIVYPLKERMLEGDYLVQVNNFRRRTTDKQGFEVEIECEGETLVYTSNINPAGGATFDIARIRYTKNEGVTVKGQFSDKKPVSKEVYGISTNKFHPVSMILPSPNHWQGEGRGNFHTFFLIDKAKTDAPIRGFFNEFLKPELSEYRKAFELLGEMTKIEPAEQQLAGLGFSSTLRAELVVRVTGSFTRVIKVKF